jgi:hypothetical protein
MRTRSLAAGVLATALLLTGCGGGDDPGASPSPSSSSAEAQQVAALRRVSACIRQHGYPNFPDPSQQPNGQWNWPDSYNSTFRNVTACHTLLNAAKALMGGPRDRQKVDAATLAKLRDFAKCMREKGIPDWPDPTPFGTFKLPPRFHATDGASKESAVAKFRTQQQACEHLGPRNGISLEF